MVELVVSKGLHAGAQVRLQAGTHRLGAATDCDVVLSDEGVGSHALTLDITGDGATATIFEDGVLVHRNGRWQQLAAGESLPLQRPAELLQLGAAVIACLSAEPLPQGADLVGERPNAGTGSDRAGRAARGWIAALVAGLALFVGTGVILASVDRSEPRSSSMVVNERLAAVGLGGRLAVEAGQSADDPIQIAGVVDSEATLAALRQAVAGLPTELVVVTRDQVADALAEVTAVQPDAVQLAATEDGSLRLEGVVAGSRERDELRIAMRRAFPHITRFEMRVVTLTEVADSLATKLAEVGLSRALSVQQRRDGLTLQGSIASRQAPALREVERWLADRYGRQVPLLLDLERELPGDPLDGLAAVRLGDDPHLLMSSGRRVRPGELLDDDWRVERIGDDGISLQRSGERRIIEF